MSDFLPFWKMNPKFQLGFRESHKDLESYTRKGVFFSVTKEKISAPVYSSIHVFLGHGCAYVDSPLKKKIQVNHMQLDNFSVLCIQCGIISSPIYLTHPLPQILSILYSNSLYAYFLCSFKTDNVIIGNNVINTSTNQVKKNE